MESKLNKLLLRQIKRHFGSVDNIPEQLHGILNDINNTYENLDEDVHLLQNSIEISSKELRSAYQKHKEDAEKQKKILHKIDEAIQAIKPTSQEGVTVNGSKSSDSNYMVDSLINLIEEQKKAEAEILKLSIAIEQNPASIVITDLHGIIEYVNPKFCDLTGYKREEAIGQNPKILNGTTYPPDFFHGLWETILSGKTWKGEFNNKKKNGELYWELASISAVKNHDGEIVSFLAIKEDITERKNTELTLLNERALFRTIIDLIPDAVYVKDTFGRKILANPKEVQFSGKRSEEEIIGKTDFDIYSSGQAQRSFDEDQKVLRSGNPVLNIEGVLTDIDGILHSLLVSKVPLYDVKGKITGIVGVTHDITERKKAEQQLQTAHKSLSDILQAAIHTAIISTDINGVITVFSKGAEKILGYSADELIGKKTPELFHSKREVDEHGIRLSEEFGREIKGFEALVEKAKVQDHEERTWTYIRENGTSIAVNLIVSAIRDNKNHITGFLGIANDITQRKQVEEELKRASTRLALATFAGGVGVWDLDIVSNKLVWDDQMFALYGINNQYIINGYQIWINGVHPQDKKRAEEEIQMAIRGEKVFDTEFRVCWPDESVHTIRALATVQLDNSGKPLRMIGTNWDITEQKKTETVLLKARKEAEMANKAKSVFLANMSHEIRTPLNAIIGFSQLMNREKHLTNIQKEYNVSIIRAGEHLLALINDILELSKMEAGRLELNPINIDIYSLFADIQMLFKEPARSKHLEFNFELASNMPQYVIVDDNKLRRIFINLIGNAIKFTDKGEVDVCVQIVETKNHNTILRVDVKDTGPGISENELDKLFKHFVQTSTGINKNNGTGLGLALSRELAVLMGGDITVTSEVGKGSVFTFQILIHKGKAAAVQEKISQQVVGIENKMSEYRILVVDDIEENLKVAVNLLQIVGFETMKATNGEEAIKKSMEWNPHLILMDMRMPVMDGYEATRRIKLTDKGAQIPIVALTASSFDDERKKIHELGIQGHIRKPFQENELLGTIGNILDIKYIFENIAPVMVEKYKMNDPKVNLDIAKLPERLVLKMREAVEVADLDLLIELIKSIDTSNAALAQHLAEIANNYDYEHLELILSNKELRQ